MRVEVMIMYVRIDYNLKCKKKKWEEKYYLVIFFWLIISVKKINVVSLVIKREKCFDWWEVGSVEIN